MHKKHTYLMNESDYYRHCKTQIKERQGTALCQIHIVPFDRPLNEFNNCLFCNKLHK